MKVGILTFSKSINYGATLQAAALSHTISRLGGQSFMIDHPCAMIDSSSKIFEFSRLLSPAYTLPHVVNMPIAIKRTAAFKEFWKKHFTFSDDNPQDYDMIVTGSDQVWNYNLTGDDMFYFLDFKSDKVKKVSYAASFGISQTDKEHDQKLKPLLDDFDAISVREKTGANIVGDITGKKAQVVLDPTLLLDKNDWQGFAKKDYKDSGYIFVYTVFNSDKLWDFAYKLSEKTGLAIKTISYSKFHRHNAQYSFSAGPDEWVSAIMNADYVVTNSFHGFAFSVNFEKQFFFEAPPKSSGVGSRITDMAETYSLSDRNIENLSDHDIDYSIVTPKIQSARRQSLEFIINFLNQ